MVIVPKGTVACPCAPCRGGFARRAGRRFIEHAYWYAVLLGMPHCMPARRV